MVAFVFREIVMSVIYVHHSRNDEQWNKKAKGSQKRDVLEWIKLFAKP